MRRLRFAIFAAALTGFAPAGARSEPSRVPDAPPAPAKLSEMADALQRVQARMTQGDSKAYPESVALLKTMGGAIAAAPPGTWKDRREAQALAIFILSGGPLADVVPLLRGETVPENERPLARGALAYMTGHAADALALLRSVDVKTLDARVAGHVAFARSLLESKHDPKAAIALLDWARLVAPGTLVEEAASRRELGLLAEAHDSQRVALLTRQYVSRFPASVYAPEFFRTFGRKIAEDGLADDPAQYKRLSDASRALAPDSRRDFLLGLARAATIRARFGAAEAAAEDALGGAAPGSPEEARARLYLAAGRIFTADPETARADLEAIDSAPLDRSDAALLAAARSVAAQLRIAPSPGAIEAQAEAIAKDKSGAGATIATAEGALQRTVALANGTSQ